MTKQKSVLGAIRVLIFTALFVASSIVIYAQTRAVADDIAIHLTCSIGETYSGVIVGDDAYHLSCTISERYTGIIIEDQPVLVDAQ
jgi:hypothetical protein